MSNAGWIGVWHLRVLSIGFPHNKLAALQGLDKIFKECKTGSVSKEIIRIEELLKEDTSWAGKKVWF